MNKKYSNLDKEKNIEGKNSLIFHCFANNHLHNCQKVQLKKILPKEKELANFKST